MPELQIGVVLDYESIRSRASIELREPLSIGDVVHIKGEFEDFFQTIESMQVHFNDVQQAQCGESVSIWLQKPVHPRAKVYKVI